MANGSPEEDALPPSDADLAFEVLSRALAALPLSRSESLRPINFHVEGAAWSFDPRRAQAPLERGGTAGAPLSLWLTAPTLLRLLLEKGTDVRALAPTIRFEGDSTALLPFIDVLGSAGLDPVSVRRRKR